LPALGKKRNSESMKYRNKESKEELEAKPEFLQEYG